MSRYGTIRKSARPIPGNKVKADGKDYRKYYRCVYCGFVCNIERDKLGESNSKCCEALPLSYGGIITCGQGTGYPCVLMELGPDEEYKAIVSTKKFVSKGGCPACGSLNWQGNY